MLGIEILRAAGYPIEDGRENVVWVKVRDGLQRQGVLVVHIDEVNNLVDTANLIEQQKISNSLKSMLNNERWPVVLILSGTPDNEPIIARDKQLRRRVDVVWLRALVPGLDNKKISNPIAGLCRAANVVLPEATLERAAPRLMQAGAFQYGMGIEIAMQAVIGAAETRAPLGLDHFADAYARRTGSAADRNPFLSAMWQAIVSAWSTDGEAGQAEEEGAGGHKPRKSCTLKEVR